MTERNVKDDPSQTYLATVYFMTNALDLMPRELRHKVAGYLQDSLADSLLNDLLTTPWLRLSSVDTARVEASINTVAETLKGEDPDRDRVVDRIRSLPGPRRMEY